MPETLSVDEFAKEYQAQSSSSASAPSLSVDEFAGQYPSAPQPLAPTSPDQPPQPKSLPSRVVGTVLPNTKAFGETIGGTFTRFTPEYKAALQAEQEQSDSEFKFIRTMNERMREGLPLSDNQTRLYKEIAGAPPKPNLTKELIPATEKSNKQVMGEALGFAGEVVGAGSLPKLGSKILLTPTTFLGGALQGAWQGLKTGALFGAVQGAAGGLQEDRDALGVGVDAAVGAGVGGATGGALGGLIGGIAGSLRGGKLGEKLGTSQRQEAARAAFEAGEDANEATAPYLKPRMDAVDSAARTLKRDPLATAAINQGIPERDIALIKASTPADREVFKEMAALAEKASQDRTVTKRPMDIAGENIIKPAKALSAKIRGLASELDTVADGLRGKPVAASPQVVQQIDDDIADLGASISEGKIDFSGSALEDVGGNTRILQNVYRRVRTAKDALDFHRIKKYIDTNVEYGRASEGLVGEAEQILKRWRHVIDLALDTEYSAYNNVNTKLAEVIKPLDDLTSSIGARFRVTEPLAEIRAGQVASRLLTNSPSRGQVLTALTNLADTAKKYGVETKGDVVFQVNFADMLEDIFGTQATRGFQGGIERGVERAGEGLIDNLAQGRIGPGELIVKGAAEAIKKGLGRTPEQKIHAFKALIGL